MYVSIDDTDSVNGMCTTYLAAVILREFKLQKGIKIQKTDYPRLVRLNPNVPYKTRGNGAVFFHVPDAVFDEKTVLNYVERYSMLDDDNTNPGVVFISDDEFYRKRNILNEFYNKAVSELCEIKDAEEVLKKINARIHRFKNGRGIIGALAALGCDFLDHTFEILAYRKEENFKKKRLIDEESVFNMNHLLYPETYDNVDLEEHKIVFMPRGKDPVFCGIRGENPEIVEKAFNMIKPGEEISFTQIFITNQNTDAHLKPKKISELKPYGNGIITGTVVENPKRIKKGHTFFRIRDETGEINCAAYGPTGDFRDVVFELRVNDLVRVYGGISRYKDTFNLEKMEILNLEKIYVKENPMCVECNLRMKSEGKNKGFQCRRCGKKLPANAVKFIETKREIKEGFYEVRPMCRRHLSKPLCRFHLLKKQNQNQSNS